VKPVRDLYRKVYFSVHTVCDRCNRITYNSGQSNVFERKLTVTVTAKSVPKSMTALVMSPYLAHAKAEFGNMSTKY
jgi:hypothetical protein